MSFCFPSYAYVNDALVETAPKKVSEGPVVLQGKVSWAGFVDHYFMTSVVPLYRQSRDRNPAGFGETG